MERIIKSRFLVLPDAVTPPEKGPASDTQNERKTAYPISLGGPGAVCSVFYRKEVIRPILPFGASGGG
jgi:hypothetical protein